MTTSTPQSPQETELPILAGLATCLRWCEELLNIVNGPLLMFGAGIALVDLLTDGNLTATTPTLLLAWALSQALGIDTQLLGCFARARAALDAQRHWITTGWVLLGIVLGYAAWQAGYVFAVQQSQHISEAAALAQLGMSPTVWLGWRAFLAVGLVALSGWTRYRRPRTDLAASTADEKARLLADIELEPLRQRARAQKLTGAAQVARATVAAVRGEDDATVPSGDAVNASRAPMTRPLLPPLPMRADDARDDVPPRRPPTGPGSPSAAPSEDANEHDDDAHKASASKRRAPGAKRPGQPRLRPVREPAETRIRRVWETRPGASVRLIARRAGVSESTASKWRALLVQEDENAPASKQAEGQAAQ